MHLIPVIDLLDNQVVHAKRGQREHYQAIQSSLCNSSAPIDIIAALLELYPFTTLYIADLNAIQKRGNHMQMIARIQQKFPNLSIWLDAGITNISDLSIWKNINTHWVIGTESLISIHDYTQLKQTLHSKFTLSLDFNKDGYKGPIELLRQTSLWPQQVIAMTLTLVGSGEGADMKRLTSIIKQAPSIKLYAAGGIRNILDLNALSANHVHGALVASALHHGQITRQSLETLSPCD